MFKPKTSAKPNRLLAALDQEIGFVNKINSRIADIRRGYDEQTCEYVIWLEYRTQVKPGVLKDNARASTYPLISEISDRLPQPGV